ncbi:MAG: magnesium transporter, partial [Candidatus Woesearchaeota archaeon]
GLAVFCSIMIATVFALLIPFILEKLNKDPAIGSGPFTTIIQDILSVLIYFFYCKNSTTLIKKLITF